MRCSYACNIGSVCCQEGYSIKCTYSRTHGIGISKSTFIEQINNIAATEDQSSTKNLKNISQYLSPINTINWSTCNKKQQ